MEYEAILLKGLWETVYMTALSALLAYALGLPIGVLLYTSGEKGLAPRPILHGVLDKTVNIIRAVPFTILMLLLMPVSSFVTGSSIGPSSAVLSLVIGSAPLVGRMCESSFDELDRGVIETAVLSSATPFQVVTKVLISESLPSLVRGFSVISVTLLGYSAMAGALGAGGLGDIAVRYGMHRYNYPVMLATVAVIVVLVQLIQKYLSLFAEKIDKRKV